MKTPGYRDDLVRTISIFIDSSYEDYENLTKEEIEWMNLVEEKSISKKQCEEKGINVSLFALEELEKNGFNKDISTYVLSKLVEDLYHERKVFSSEDYFDLSKSDNKHYSNLVDYFKVGDEQLYRALVAKSIGDSKYETKNVNDIVYGTVKNVSKMINNKPTIKYEP